MKLRRFLTRRRLKWSLTLATLVIAAGYAFSLVHGSKYQPDPGRTWTLWFWVMRGRLELAVERFPIGPRDRPFRDYFNPSPVKDANSFYWNKRADPTITNTYYRVMRDQYPWFQTRPNPRFDLQRSGGPLFRNGSGWVYVAVPLWFPFLLVTAPTACLWYTDRKSKPGHCPHCRYDLAGLNVRSESGPTGGNGVCPECGRPTEREA